MREAAFSLSGTCEQFLARVMVAIRRDRPQLDPARPFYIRREIVCRDTFAALWFTSRGCSWDRRGACTMCNYGEGQALGDDETIEVVRAGLRSLDGSVGELFVSPSGSMFDEREVTPTARRRIYDLMRATPAKQYSIETRAETVTTDCARELRHSLAGRTVTVGLGLESASPTVQRACIGRHAADGSFEHAVETLHASGLDTCANVSLGTAFLHESEAIDDAVGTARWALDLGMKCTVVFPLHAKPYTLTGVLHEMGLYEPPSLWSLIEVLRRIGPERIERAGISWYRNYYEDAEQCIASPDTCPSCREEVLCVLDEYRANASVEALERLESLACKCKERWHEVVLSPRERPLGARMFDIYKQLAARFGLDEWLAARSSVVERELSTTRVSRA